MKKFAGYVIFNELSGRNLAENFRSRLMAEKYIAEKNLNRKVFRVKGVWRK